jgi:hypothetical protein
VGAEGGRRAAIAELRDMVRMTGNGDTGEARDAATMPAKARSSTSGIAPIPWSGKSPDGAQSSRGNGTVAWKAFVFADGGHIRG